MQIDEIIDAAKTKHGLQSDYALAKMLKWGDSKISNYRSGRSLPSDEDALVLAEIAGIDPLQIITMTHAARSKDPKVKRFWEALGKTERAIVAKLGVTILFLGSMLSMIDKVGPSIHYTNWLKALKALINSLRRHNESRTTRRNRPIDPEMHQPAKTA